MKKIICMILMFLIIILPVGFLRSETITVEVDQYEVGKIDGARDAQLNAIGNGLVGGALTCGSTAVGTMLFGFGGGMTFGSVIGTGIVFYSSQKSYYNPDCFGQDPEYVMGYVSEYREVERKNNLITTIIGVGLGITIGAIISSNLDKNIKR
jgi:hypothetical protein